MHRVWLDFSQSCLTAAAEWFIDRHRRRGACDMQHLICVTPGRRAGRLLLEVLLRECEGAALSFTPPSIITPGVMAEALLPIDRPVADDCESVLAWADAIRSCDPKVTRAFLPVRPAQGDLAAWHETGRKIALLHEELAGWRLDFPEVAEAAERKEMFAEGDRWRALVKSIAFTSFLITGNFYMPN